MKKSMLPWIACALLLCGGAAAEERGVEAVAEGLVVHEFGFVWETGVSDDEVTVQDLLGDLPSHVRHEAKETPIEQLNAAGGEFDGGRPLPPVTGGVPSIPSTTVGDPFVFFYSDRKHTVDVSVEFTDGRPIAWFPRADEYWMQKLVWKEVGVHPRKPKHRNLKPFRDEGDKSKWQGMSRARKIDGTCYLECRTQLEKYLFYEAAVSYPTALIYEARGDSRRSRGFGLTNTRDFTFHDLYVFPAKGDGRAEIAYLPELQAGEQVEVWFAADTYVPDPRIQWIELEALHEHLAARAAAQGLREDEAALCAETVLEAGFMRSRGRKAIYRLPSVEYDRIYPLTITPAPEETVRVGMVLVPDLRNRSLEHLGSIALAKRSTDRARARGALADVPELATPYLEGLKGRTRNKKQARYLEQAIEAVRAAQE